MPRWRPRGRLSKTACWANNRPSPCTQGAGLDTSALHMDLITHVLSNWQQYLGVVTAVLAAAIAVATVIPGDEPENTLQKIVDFIAQISRK